MSHNSFGDVEDEIDGQRGVLDGKAFRNHELVVDKMNKSGLGWDFTCNCQHCNRQSTVTLVWPELIVASVGVLPIDVETNRPWIAQNGFMYPPVQCGACGQLLSIGMTPDKAQRCLSAGVGAGKVDQRFVANGQAETRQRAAHLRR